MQIDMSTPATPIDEASRLQELHDLKLDDRDGAVSQLEFDNLTHLAAEICDAPVALISVVDQHSVWFKSSLGFDAPQVPREHAFCSVAIEGVAPLIVQDASADPRFQNNESVRAPDGIRFYAGVPLLLGSGFALGTLCVLDYKARTLSGKQLKSLERLAGQVVALIEARRTRLHLLMQEKRRLVSEGRLDFALKAADIGDWDRDLRTNVARHSLSYARCYGYTEAMPEWSYDTFLAHIFEADRARVDDCYQRARVGQGAYDVEFRVVWPDQTVHWLWSKGRFYFDDDGTPNRVAGIVVDITERKEIDAALRESDSRWRFAIEGAGDGLWDWDIQNDHVFYSDTWKSMLGLETDAVGGKPEEWASHLHPDDKVRVMAEMQSHLDGQTAQYASEHRIICKDGSAKWALGRGLVVQRDESGKPLRMIGTNTDITERKQAEKDLQASLKGKTALLLEVHHRVKNNLQVISSLLRLESSRSADAPTKTVLQAMQGRVRAMALLHESIYRHGDFAAIDLGTYLGHIARESLRTLLASPGTVQLRMSVCPVQVGLDQATPAGMLVSELVSNCLKHAFPHGRGGEIGISLQPLEAPGYWRLQVHDTGIGLPVDFEAACEKSLGLVLADGMATQLGGTLQIGPAPQAVFTVDFQVANFDHPKH